MNCYYTFRLISRTPLRVQCCKWDDCLHSLLDIYTIYPQETSCNCMASKRECKHVILARAVIEEPFVNELHNWRWDEKNSWQYIEDIPLMETVVDSLSAYQ